MLLSSPVWIVALVLAVSAPWLVRLAADRMDSEVTRRTEAIVSRARARLGTAGEARRATEAEQRRAVDG
jgi:hypothetical protein